jgi:hypothetical protein
LPTARDNSRFLVEYAVRESTKTDFQMVMLCAARQYVPRGLALYEASKQDSASKRATDRETRRGIGISTAMRGRPSLAHASAFKPWITLIEMTSMNRPSAISPSTLAARKYSFVSTDLESFIEARMIQILTHRILKGGRQ